MKRRRAPSALPGFFRLVQGVFPISLGLATPARAQCPAVETFMDCRGSALSNAATFDSTCCAWGDCSLHQGFSLLRYDLGQGIFEVGGQNFSRSSVSAVDTFRISGSSPGTVVSFRAALRIQGYLFGGLYDRVAFVRATIEQVGQSSATFSAIAASGEQVVSLDVDTVLAVGVNLPILEPLILRIAFEHETVTDGHVEFFRSARLPDWGAHLVFLDLPPGMTIRSCRGFVQEFPVAVVPATWSRIKLLYSSPGRGR